MDLFDEYVGLYENSGDNYRMRHHARSVLDSLELSERGFRILSRSFCDSHNEIEKLGYHKYFKSYCVLLTLENHLDLVLNKCCGANPENVRSIPNYDFVSFVLLNLSLLPEDNIFLYNFRGYDANLDDYLYNCSLVSPEEVSANSNIVLERFFGGILDTASDIILLTAKRIYKEYDMSLRSQGFSNFVFGSLTGEVNVPDKIVFINGAQEFPIPLWKLGRGDYLKLVKEGVVL
jgi:hypothetical protein